MSLKNLGSLGRLPLELRIIVWENLCREGPSTSSQKRCIFSGPHTNNRLACLRSCRQIYKELSGIVYNKVLVVRILPTYHMGSWLTFEHPLGAKWHVKHLEDARRRGFSNLPYKRLKAVRVEIEAANHISRTNRGGDKGQIICLLFKVKDLVEIFMKTKGLPKLDIHWIDSATGKWSQDGVPACTIPFHRTGHNNLGMQEDFNNFQILFEHFDTLQHLKKSREVRHWFPVDFAKILLEIKGQQSHEQSNEHFAQQPNQSQERDEDPAPAVLQRMRDTTYLRFDFTLDGTQGPTACMLRLHRFGTWYPRGLKAGSDYLNELLRLFDEYSTEADVLGNLVAVEKRAHLAMALNPQFAKLNGTPSTERFTPWKEYLDVFKRIESRGQSSMRRARGKGSRARRERLATDADMFLASIAEGLDIESWYRHYPDGIEGWAWYENSWREQAGKRSILQLQWIGE